MSRPTRRTFLMCSLLGTQAVLAGCGGGGGGDAVATSAALSSNPPSAAPSDPVVVATAPPPPAPTTSAPVWDMHGLLALYADSSSSFDMSSTLPVGVKRGGTFSIDSSRTPLPNGLRLRADGFLIADTGTALGSVSGVVFKYAEP